MQLTITVDFETGDEMEDNLNKAIEDLEVALGINYDEDKQLYKLTITK